MRTRFWSNARVLVHDKCGDKSNPNLMKCIDNIFKSHFWEWKFDNQRAAELHRELEPPVEE
ncbi:hypothetical protein D8674_005884 [Pyrus ussuriensis x Pyrus communis]|uniref:Uncharacterized protein n=1 Tax=Pyrus ussuriensis x Pyrus communis TaxID=2448454 RepID=A0A5N5FTD9_9ROSA|nr:hypothetical protein D8674_005884 [Pyrus ussuriensis x Pyrus communis]